MTKRGARPDEARAANHLLRLSLEGRICLYLRPPNYTAEEEQWRNHPDVKEICHIQALGKNISPPWLDDIDQEESDAEDESDDTDSDDSNDDEDQLAAAAPSRNKFALLEDE